MVKRKGLKFDNFHHFLTHNDVSKYDAIWVVDDDIIIDTGSINQMFQIFSEYKSIITLKNNIIKIVYYKMINSCEKIHPS